MPRKVYLLCVFVLATGLTLAGCGKAMDGYGEASANPVEAYQPKDFGRLVGMQGFSDALLQNHFKLYQGYVKNSNLLLDQLQALLKAGNVNSAEFAELKRRLGFELNGMKLHELYFSNLGGKTPLDAKRPLYQAIVRNFGSFELWRKDFVATGAMRGIGWVVLYADPQSGRLINLWINDHEVNHPAGFAPVLVMDVWEHAYMLDYQLDRGKYMEAFFNNIDWDEVAARYDRSVQAAGAVDNKAQPAGTATGAPSPTPAKLRQT